jgi:uncharacterized protein YihD (DUF1040 family)
MTIEGIIRMAKEAGFADEEIDVCQQILIHFAKLVAEHEREACANLCDDLDQKLWEDMGESMSGYGEAIRERT